MYADDVELEQFMKKDGSPSAKLKYQVSDMFLVSGQQQPQQAPQNQAQDANAAKAARLMNDKFEQRFEIEKMLVGGMIKMDMLCDGYRAYIKQLLLEDKLAKSTVEKRGYTLDRVKMELGKVYARDIKTI